MFALESPGAIWSKCCLRCFRILPRNISSGKQRCQHTHTTLPSTVPLFYFPLAFPAQCQIFSSCSENSDTFSTSSTFLPPVVASHWLSQTPSRHTHTASSFSFSLTLISQGSTPVLVLFLLTTYFASGLSLSPARQLFFLLPSPSFSLITPSGNATFLVTSRSHPPVQCSIPHFFPTVIERGIWKSLVIWNISY